MNALDLISDQNGPAVIAMRTARATSIRIFHHIGFPFAMHRNPAWVSVHLLLVPNTRRPVSNS